MCSIIIQLLSSGSNLSAPTPHRLMPVSALRVPPVRECFWNIREHLTGRQGIWNFVLGSLELSRNVTIIVFARIYKKVLYFLAQL